MASRDRSRSVRLEPLESRALLTLIGSAPTIDVIAGPGVKHLASGEISILQPAAIHVVGTAQPGAPGTTVSVGIFAEDSQGNVLNGGLPLAAVTPNMLGTYRATVFLPSILRKDVNFLVARETATATETSTLAINGTTISDLSGNLSLGATTLSGLTGTLATASTTITGLTGTISTPAEGVGLGGVALNIAAFPLTIGGGGGTPGVAGPATGTLVGGFTIPATSASLSAGAGALAASTGTLTETGTAAVGATAGFLTGGTGTIAPTTGTATQVVTEVAVSNPLAVLIHQPKTPGHPLAHVAIPQLGTTTNALAGAVAAVEYYDALHRR